VPILSYRITDVSEVQRLLKKGRIKQSDRAAALAALNQQPLSRNKTEAQAGEYSAYPPGNTADDCPAKLMYHLMTREFGCYFHGGLVVLELACIPGRRFRADVALPSYMVTLEIEGWQFHSKKKSFQSDRERKLQFFKRGWRVLEVTNKLIKENPEVIIEAVRELTAKLTPRTNFKVVRNSHATNKLIEYD